LLNAFVGELSRSLRARAKRELGLASVTETYTGGVTFVQRFDSGWRLNVHLHSLAMDDVYVREGDDGPLVFHALPEPSQDEVAERARRVAARVAKLLERLGRSLDPEIDASPDALELEHPALADCYGAACRGIDLLGARAAEPTLRIVEPLAGRPNEPVARVAGFNVHAGLVVDGRDRKRLERICRYAGRPPIAQERLERLDDGRLRCGRHNAVDERCCARLASLGSLPPARMKKPWRDGTTALVFEPLDLVARICAMIPPPWFHMVRYHGVLAPSAKLRAEVVPAPSSNPQPKTATGPQLALDLPGSTTTSAQRRKPWAWLLRHVFAEDRAVASRRAERRPSRSTGDRAASTARLRALRRTHSMARGARVTRVARRDPKP
jgi:hypothetical protein